ncbi:MAG: selenide, water dikinase SelD, partial [Pirellulaceae bacterium]
DDERLLVGLDGFSDAAVYLIKDDLCIVQSLDFFPPLVDDPFTYGQIAAANSLSDIYAMGAEPITALNIVGFPDDKLDLKILQEILRGGAERVALAGAVIAGGHTVRDAEIKYGLSATGTVLRGEMLTNQGAQPGDQLVLTKALGTGFITTAFKAGRCPDATLANAVESMVQLNGAASRAAVSLGATAVTDITGFGLAGHAGEMAQSSGVMLSIEVSSLPLLEGALALARQGNLTRASKTNRSFSASHLTIGSGVSNELVEFAFDAQTSGGLLISISEDRAGELVARLKDEGIAAACTIGSVETLDEASIRLV